ncbi:MAG: DUF971 domain-containing protein [Pseudomonadota bacterium]|nr:DUF971 domain-containing protein [Pseudomonadota bacterium]MEC8525398.1 DUF971 domain-containing protein [Pseudomonadota bacterium]
MIPEAIKVKKSSRCVVLTYDAVECELSFELLRVMSPSAEVRGHGAGNEVLQYGKRDVGLLNLEPVGNYALKLTFDDGHDTGIYNWSYLHHLCLNQTTLWQEYLQRLEQSGKSRESSAIAFKSL